MSVRKDREIFSTRELMNAAAADWPFTRLGTGVTTDRLALNWLRPNCLPPSLNGQLWLGRIPVIAHLRIPPTPWANTQQTLVFCCLTSAM